MNSKIVRMAFVLIFSNLLFTASAETLTWNGGEQGLWKANGGGWLNELGEQAQWVDGSDASIPSGGMIQIDPDGVELGSLSIKSEELLLQGGPLSFTAPVSMIGNQSARGVTIDAPIIAAPGTELIFGAKASASFNQFLQKTEQLVYPNGVLTEIEGFYARTGGGTISSNNLMSACQDVYTESGSRTIQFQSFEGNYTKCVKAEFFQRPEGVTAKILYARYWSTAGIDVVGENFDTGTTTAMSIATSWGAWGYGISSLELYDKTDNINLAGTTLLKGIRSNGKVSVGKGLLSLCGKDTLNDGLFSGQLEINGILNLFPQQGLVFSTPIEGAGKCFIKGTDTLPTEVQTEGCLSLEPSILIRNRRLAHLSEVLSAFPIGQAVTQQAKTAPVTPCYFRNEGTEATVQLQFYDSGFTKCAIVRFRQEGPDISAWIDSSHKCYITPQIIGLHFPNPKDFQEVPVAAGDDQQGIGIKDITLSFGSRVFLSQGIYLNGGLTISDAAEVVTLHQIENKILKGLVVKDHAKLFINHDNRKPIGGSYAYEILNHGEIIAENDASIQEIGPTGRPIKISNGTLRFFTVSPAQRESGNYVNNLFLSDGAIVQGWPIRIAYLGDAELHVSGKAPSTIQSGLILVQENNEEKAKVRKFTVEVEDVTGDPAADLIVENRVYDYSGLLGLPTEKRGAGDVSIRCPDSSIGEMRIFAGSVSLDHAKATNPRKPFVLSGGKLRLGTFPHQAGTFTLGAESALDLGSIESSIAFADSSTKEWNPEAKLRIVGDLGKKRVRFGKDMNGLSETQLSQIRCQTGRVKIDAEGYLQAESTATRIILK